MSNILFWPDIHFETGHWRPVMAMADKARTIQGHQVQFLCTPECKQIMQRSGLEVPLPYITILKRMYRIGFSSLIFERPEEAHSRMEHCLKIARGDLGDAAVAQINAFEPKLLVAGYFVAFEALLLQYWYNKDKADEDKMKLIITTTYLRHPSEDPYITSLRFLAHHSPEVSSRLMREAAQEPEGSTRFDGSINSIKEFIEPLNAVRELITCPQDLDHPHFVHRENTHYVEPSILDDLSTLPRDPKRIYATVGSRVRDYVESAKALFLILQNMVNLNFAGTRLLEMAVGYALKEAFIDSANVTIVNWATQTESLKRARSAVVHGGLATIKECIYFGIPPIIVPLGKDQMDNALRVVNKKVGSLMMLDTLNEERLYNAILAAESNLEIQKNIAKMQRTFHALEHPPEGQLPPSLDHISQELSLV